MRRLLGLWVCVLVAGACAQAWAADRDTALALVSGAEKLIKEGNFAKGAEMCQRALASDADCAEAHYQLGVCRENLSQPRDAILSYQKAMELANKAGNATLSMRAKAAGEKVCPGLLRIAEADQKLIARLLPLAEDALSAGQLETALDTYTLVLSLAPEHPKAKEGAAQARAQIEKRGDPVKAKIAEATLAEIWYQLGIGKRTEAAQMARDLSSRFGETAAGKEAADLLARDFSAPKKEEALALKKKLAEAHAQAVKADQASRTASTTPASSQPVSSTPATSNTPAKPVPTAKSKALVDLDALEKSAGDETKALAKDKVVPTFGDAFKKGLDFYSKAAPGTEGNQENLAKALEQFLRCETLYARIETDGLSTPQLEKDQQQASMLRYGCMKMVVLSH